MIQPCHATETLPKMKKPACTNVFLHAFQLSACALAASAALNVQAQIVEQTLSTSAGTTQFFDGTTTSTVPGNLGLGIIDTPVGVTVLGSGITISGDLTLGNVVTNSSTIFRVNESRNTVTGLLSTEGQALRFVLTPNLTPTSPLPNTTYLNVNDGVGSGKITAGSVLLGATDTVGIRLTGSLKNGASYRLIESATDIGGLAQTDFDFNDTLSQSVANCLVCRVTDNSYVITSRIYGENNSGGDWRYVTYEATRAPDVYVTASYTQGHFSNNAANTLGAIASNGYQLGDLVTAVNTLDLDENGFGDTAEHLAVQAKRLAPIANNSFVRSAFAVSDLSSAIVDDRLGNLRRQAPGQAKDDRQNGWVRLFANASKQSGVDDYDGYRLGTTGMAFGYDRTVGGGTRVGGMFSVANSSLRQTGFRDGNDTDIRSAQLNIYGSHEWGALYVHGMAGVGRHAYSGSRQTAINRTADADFTSKEVFTKMGLGYRIRLKDVRSVVTPYVDVTFSKLSQPGYTETGAGDLGLNFDAKSSNRARTLAGLRYQTESRIGGIPAFTTLQVAVGHDGGMGNLDVNASYSGATSSAYTRFVTPTSAFERSFVNLAGGVTLGLSQASSLQLRADMDHRKGATGFGLQAKANWSF